MQSTPTRIGKGRTPCEVYVITRSIRGGLLHGGCMDTRPAEKRCFACGERKALDEFYTHPGMTDGYVNKCRVCTLTYGRRRREAIAANPELREKVRERQRQTKRKRREDGWRDVKSQKTKDNMKIYVRISEGIRSGKIIPDDSCNRCGHDFSIYRREGHHDDYSKPLDIEWLCVKCHRRHHQGHPALDDT